MSFSERNYKHQVVIFELENEISNLKTLEIPISIPLLRMPLQPEPLEDVLLKLHFLPEKNGIEQAPYLEVQVLLEEPEPALRHKVESILKDKNVKLARIQSHYVNKKSKEHASIFATQLDELQPVDVFSKTYHAKYTTAVPEHLMKLFQQTVNEVNQTEI